MSFVNVGGHLLSHFPLNKQFSEWPEVGISEGPSILLEFSAA